MAKLEIAAILNLLSAVFEKYMYVKFSDEATGLNTMKSSYLGRKSYWVFVANVKPRFQ